MRQIDEEQRYRDELAETHRERDRQREPGRARPRGRDLAGRHAFYATIAPVQADESEVPR